MQIAQALGCDKFVTAQDIADGVEKLNLAFVANMFLEVQVARAETVAYVAFMLQLAP